MTGTEMLRSLSIMTASDSTARLKDSKDTAFGENDFEKLLQNKQEAVQSTDNSNKETTDSSGKVQETESEQTEDIQEEKTSSTEDMLEQLLQMMETMNVVKSAMEKDAQGVEEAGTEHLEISGVQEILPENPELFEVQPEAEAMSEAELSGISLEEMTGSQTQPTAEPDVLQTEMLQQAETAPIPKAEPAKVQTAETLDLEAVQPAEEAPILETAQTSQTNSQKEELLENDAFGLAAEQTERTEETGQTPLETRFTVSASGQESTIQNYHLNASAASQIGETQSTLETSEATLVQDVARTIAGNMQGNNTLTLELEPASLGKMTIRMVYEAGKAVVSIMASNPKTLELLSQKSGELAAILEDRTGEETVVQTYEPNQEAAFYEQGQGKNDRKEEQQEAYSRRARKQRSDSFAQQLRLGLI